ncbi:hypothetical protein C7Y70_03790 [Pseudoalteromonas sp. KS88]|uniref:hypothetical protein n=1 Tax=Pseudoalteromonas sp. KS88 TaxID=2109918 RepID=UPI00108203AA|nr:hypothetical protein [Pseudoalteromonas sp. KS88]TGE84677.1 hypothetical protein C7Y70_03790 [Pseudoalteromonas sp. KS88]
MNTLLLTLLLLSPADIALDKQIKQQTAHTLKAMNTTHELQLKAEISATLKNAEPLFAIKVNKQTLAKVQTEQQPLTQE